MLTPAEVSKLYRRLDRRRLTFETVSMPEITTFLRGVPAGSRFLIFSRTPAREVYKSGVPHPYRDCCVIKRREVLLKTDYTQSVNEQRVRERKRPDFKAKPRQWGGRIEDPFVLHKPQGRGFGIYLSLQVVKDLGTEYMTWGGKPIPYEDIEPYLRSPRKPSRQGLRTEVRWRDYEIVNVLAFLLPMPGGREAGFIVDLSRAYRFKVEEGILTYECTLRPARKAATKTRGAR